MWSFSHFSGKNTNKPDFMRTKQLNCLLTISLSLQCFEKLGPGTSCSKHRLLNELVKRR